MPTIVIKVKKRELPAPKNRERDFEWLCRSLGLISQRDTNKNTKRVFKTIIVATKRYGGISIPELVEVLDLSRTTIVHHLEKIRKAGLLAKKGNKFRLRRYNLKETVKEIENDLNRIFNRIEKIAEDVDRGFKLPRR